MHYGVLMYPVYFALNKNTIDMPIGFKIMSITIAIIMPIFIIIIEYISKNLISELMIIVIKKILDLLRKRKRRKSFNRKYIKT